MLIITPSGKHPFISSLHSIHCNNAFQFELVAFIDPIESKRRIMKHLKWDERWMNEKQAKNENKKIIYYFIYMCGANSTLALTVYCVHSWRIACHIQGIGLQRPFIIWLVWNFERIFFCLHTRKMFWMSIWAGYFHSHYSLWVASIFYTEKIFSRNFRWKGYYRIRKRLVHMHSISIS